LKEKKLKILIYGDSDLNLIDGSTTWLISLINVLTKNPNIQLDILLKKTILRDILIRPFLNNKQVNFINPWEVNKLKITNTNKTLDIKEAVSIIKKLDSKSPFDYIILRGFNLLIEASKNKSIALKTLGYITDFPQDKSTVTPLHMNKLKSIYKNIKYFFCQTPEFIDYYKKLLLMDNSISEDKFILVPPMIPDYNISSPTFKTAGKCLVYAGKFSTMWYTLEMVDAFIKIRNENHDIEFHMAGDKIMVDKISNFKEKMIDRLNNTDGVIWHKALNRDETEELINKCDVGISWRHPDLDEDYYELSTKVLEYGRLGKPVIMNRNPIHENLFGKDYPLYANSEDEFINQTKNALYNPEIYEFAAKRLYEVCKSFTYTEVYNILSKCIDYKKRIKILFAGHDLKFAKIIIDYFNNLADYEVKIDKWYGHNEHDEKHSRECLDWADVIIAEWGLGNAVWYSKYKKDNQVLIVRMHLQERDSPHPHKFTLQNINKIISISPFVYREFHKKLNIPKEKMTIIYNVIDSEGLNKKKIDDSKYNLAILGICPSRKRLDKALDLLESLWNKNKNYKLYIKGASPKDLGWLWKRENERKYYEKVFERINNSDWKDSVIFEQWDTDISNWFSKIGFILSPSDFESFHLAIAEGMASGSVPIIFNWDGADELYPNEFIFNEVNQASDFIDSIVNSELSISESYIKEFVANRYDKKIICKQWKNLIENETKNS